MNKELTTKDYNLKILDCLRYYIKKYPELRFQQILTNLNLIKDKNPLYNELSKETFKLLDNYINLKNKTDKLNEINEETKSINSENSFIKEYVNKSQKLFENSIEYALKSDNDICIKQNKKNYFNDNLDDNKEKQNNKLTLNEFNNIIKNNCNNLIHNYFYDLYELDDRSIIINNMYHYLWRTLIILDVNIEELLDNCFKTLPKFKLTDNYLYDIHLYILSYLFNNYIQIKYNNKFKLYKDFYNNILRFKFKEIQNNNYHGSMSDKTIYELTYEVNKDFESIYNKINNFINLYDDIKYLLTNKIDIHYINELNSNDIFEIEKIYSDEIKILMEELEN